MLYANQTPKGLETPADACTALNMNPETSFLDLYDLLDDIGITSNSTRTDTSSSSRSNKKLLLLPSANARIPDTGRTLLHEAAIKGDVSTIDQLIRGDGADAHKTTLLGRNTALHLASERGNIHAVKALLAYREANPNVKNKYGATPLHLAQSVAVADMLIFRGASMDCRDNNNQTPLQAISKRKEETEDNSRIVQHLTALIEERTREEIRMELNVNRERRRQIQALKTEQRRLEKEENARELNKRLLDQYRRWRGSQLDR